jgi:GNAT superfamily N-acetyltransferase
MVEMAEALGKALAFAECSPDSPKASGLLDTLSSELFGRFGSDGRSSFADWRAGEPGYIFVVAMLGDEAVACGAIRPVRPGVGEVKRMFVKYRRRGIGSALLAELERRASAQSYQWLWLETRTANREAVDFYLSQSCRIRTNFGKYVGNPDAICFEKQLTF